MRRGSQDDRPAFREALKKRGIEDMSLVMVDAWSAGHYGNEPAEDQGKRLVRALCWVRSEPMDNGYARPIEGVVAVIDLNRKEVVRVEDYGVVPLPPKAGNWARESIPQPRADLKPLEVSQPDGPELHSERPRGPLAEVVVPRRVQPPRGAGAAHGRATTAGPILYRGVDRRDDRPLRRPQGVVLPQERLRPGRVRRRHDGQLAGPGLRLPGHDPLLRRPPGRQPGPGRHDQERDLPARGRLRHALEAHRLAHRPVGGAPLAPAGRLDGRHRGQLRLRLLLVLLPGRHDPDGGQAHRAS